MRFKVGDRVVWHLTRPPVAGKVLSVDDNVTVFYTIELDDLRPARQSKIVTLTGTALIEERPGV